MRKAACSKRQGLSLFVISFLCILAIGCTGGESSNSTAVAQSEYAAPIQIGSIQTDEIKESSGLAVSLCQPNVLWTHNDAGRDSFIYALSPEGRLLGTWRVPNAQNIDWEDIAEYKDAGGKCFLYIGDIGDNGEARPDVEVFRVPEPAVTPDAASSTTTKSLTTASAEAFRFTYSDGKHNAETLMVNQQTGDLYVVTKEKKGPASVYKISPQFGSAAVANAARLGQLAVPSDPEGRLTGGAISPDGKRLILTDLKNGYEFKLPDGAANFDAVFSQKPAIVDLGNRPQGESVSYSPDGTSVYASSEKKNAPLFMAKRK
jgi:hypothetical protein